MSELIPWSHSRIVDFEKCKFRFKLKYLDRIPEPERPLREGEVERPNERGDRIHKAAEAWIKTGGPLPVELEAFAGEFDRARQYHLEGKLQVEQEWGYDCGWQPTGYFDSNVWLRVKQDGFVQHSPQIALTYDIKSGKKSGNEVKHHEQGSLYALSGFFRYPELQTVHVEFWYIDKNDITHQSYTREQSTKQLKTWNRRALAISEEKTWKPNPNQHTCRFCYYGPKGNKACPVGV